jgi:acetoacetyl-CoA reductase
MTNKLAIVTGGTRGIGLEISKSLIADGYAVVAFYHGNDAAAEQAEVDVPGLRAFKCDVADYDVCQAAVTDIEAQHGGVSVLVNNAGITRDGFLHKMTADQWRAVLSTNLDSCFNMCRAVVPGMRERQQGRIVNISSINGQKGQLGQTNYAAAKAGMIGFTKALALENASKGITVNAICPGYIETDMTADMNPDVLSSIIKQIPVARMGKPSEIGAAVAFLCGDAAAFITGATLSVNGGQLMV